MRMIGRGKGKPWTDEEKNMLIKSFPVLSWKQILIALPYRTEYAIARMANRLGLRRGRIGSTRIPIAKHVIMKIEYKTEWSDISLAYLAAAIDCDGCISIGEDKIRKKFSPCLLVGNTNKKLMDWLVKHFGGSVAKYPPSGKETKYNYHWRIGTRHYVRIVLEKLIPFLTNKRDKALAVIDLIDEKIDMEEAKARMNGVP